MTDTIAVLETDSTGMYQGVEGQEYCHMGYDEIFLRSFLFLFGLYYRVYLQNL